MIFAKIFLGLVGLLYAGLAIWCSVSPSVTSEKVGFEIKSGSGQSEFLTVYGGLEMGMALIFLLPLIRSEFLFSSLIACILIHVCLVVFRTVGFFLYTDISGMTYKLAAGEWVILVLGIVCAVLMKSGSTIATSN